MPDSLENDHRRITPGLIAPEYVCISDNVITAFLLFEATF